MTRWSELTGDNSGREYADRFAALAASGVAMHGEADFCHSLLAAPARVLDAGCGTGRVAIRLAELGHDCVGIDADESMLAVARQSAPELPWVHGDLSRTDLTTLGGDRGFDLVVAAGNVIPLLAAGSLDTVLRLLSAAVAPDGLLVAGFGLVRTKLPRGCPVTPATDYLAACASVGLVETARCSTWQGADFDAGEGYLVSVHRRGSVSRPGQTAQQPT
ncbi:class I SAM-dependent methyltransferase [soil metagenome]|jgi:2-polyprenyl-3-methyl-5-hydroxy-6-metoxy-1,4-benzoquinol methylase